MSDQDQPASAPIAEQVNSHENGEERAAKRLRVDEPTINTETQQNGSTIENGSTQNGQDRPIDARDRRSGLAPVKKE